MLYQSEYDILKATIKENAFSTSKYNNGLIISLKEHNENYYSLYYSKIINKQKLEKPVRLKIKNRNKYFHLSNGTFLPIFNEFYFTSNNKLGKLVLYRCQINEMELIKPKIVKLPKTENLSGHSTFSKNGLKMILSSGNSENIDLKLYTRVDQFSKWEFARNISELNSENKELHPTLVNDSLIYYSRLNNKNKKMDIYYSRLKSDDIWSNPKIYKPLNSSSDDFGIVFMNEDSGYFSSNRDGSDKIFYFENRK